MKPVSSNNLINESSLYLQQHAHNPVNWQVWSEASLQQAKAEDKPILISIGYAACHWCHVMENESFTNEATAELMNRYFINIKIDREERPDLDHIYMEAVQLISGSGGWPLNVFLTPDGKPFYGGTYFPPQRAFNRMSWPEVLQTIHYNWMHNRAEIEEQANQLMEHISQSGKSFYTSVKSMTDFDQTEKDSKQYVADVAENMLKQADKVQGGFGNAPKFPQTFTLKYLLNYAALSGHEPSLAQVNLSLQKMIHAGITDQVGGGLFRYSTDAKWLVPHFEKMLYDNALWLSTLGNAYQHTKNIIYKNEIIKTITFLQSEMKNEEGGYYTAIDADSEGVEGKFYVWSKKEIDDCLGTDADFYTAYYKVTENGNWEGKNILEVSEQAEMLISKYGFTIPAGQEKLAALNQKLYRLRSKRIRPATDDKILLGWNALLLKAFCNSYAALGTAAYKTSAIALADFLSAKFKHQHQYWHTYKNGEAKYPAFLDDLAYWVDALIALQEITGNQQYLWDAKEIVAEVWQNFSDEKNIYFYFTSANQTDVLIRKLELYDGATASANAVMANNLIYLSVVFQNDDYYDRALKMVNGLKDIVKKHPNSFAVWANTIAKLTFGIKEIIITGNNFLPMLQQILPTFIAHKVLVSSSSNQELPILKGKTVAKETKVYICNNRSCAEPVNTLQNFLTLIKK